jgi:Domain of unknown function (DUF4188)
MPALKPGRWTHETPSGTDELTVFLIGMRINRWWRPDAWLPTAASMGPMLAELSRDPEAGLLGFRTWVGLGEVMVVQYWRSPEHLYRYASDRSASHRPAWAAYNRRVRRVPGAVGIWHETFPVTSAESLYGDMPPSGLAAALGVRPVSDASRARQRLASGAAASPPGTTA